MSFPEAAATLYPAQQSLLQEINPRVYRRPEWSQLLRERGAFANAVLAGPRLDIIGNLE